MKGRILRLIATCLSVIALGACSAAVQPPKSAATEADSAANAETAPAEKKICRDLSTTGSYGPRHACHTKAEWEKIDALS